MNIIETLTNHRYYDRSNDLIHNLSNTEIDRLAHFLYTCEYGTDYDEAHVHRLADNVIKKRLKSRKVQHPNN